MTKFRVGLAAAFVLGIAALFAIVGKAQGPALPPGEYDLEAGQYIFNVPALEETPVPPTDTPVPPTETPIPPTETPVPGHDPDVWHPLTEAFAHEHGLIDPNSVNDIFGEPGCWFGSCGRSISYSFATPGENVDKHNIYTWLIRRDLPSNGNAVWIKAFRWQAHFTGGVLFDENGDPFGGYLTRFHSTSVEAQVCRTFDEACGIVRFGGAMDTGCLKIDGAFNCLPGEEEREGSQSHQRAHVTGFGKRNNVLWYGKLGSPAFDLAPLGSITVNLGTEDGSLTVFPDDIFNPVFICPDFDCVFNESTKSEHELSFRLDARHDDDGDGLISISGFTDSRGLYALSCTAPGPSCVPYSVENVPVSARVTFKAQAPGALPSGEPVFFENDTSPEGEWWIRFPN